MLNPFRNAVVGDPWERPEADVGDIGKPAFEACCKAIATTLAQHRTSAVLIRGEPGSGKTHVIRRLRAYLGESPDYQLRETLFVYVRLMTTPAMIWRHLRRRITDDLLRPTPDGTMQLEWMIYRCLAAQGSRGDLLDRWKRELSGGLPWDERAFVNALAATLRALPENRLTSLELFHSLDGEAQLPPGLVRVLRRFATRRDLGLAHAWLRGDSLTAAELEKLGIAEDPLLDEDPEYVAREMVIAITRLAGEKVPMLLCFDQVEALETIAGDLSGFVAFGGVASTLHDEAKNTVLVSCMQSAVLGKFRRADYARLAEHSVHLQSLGRQDATRLIQARLAASPGYTWLPPESELAAVFNEQGRASARAILNRAAELFDRTVTHVPAPALTLSSFLQQEWEKRMDSAVESIAPGNVDDLLGQGIPALIAAGHGKWKPTNGSGDIDVRVESEGGPVGVSVCNQKNMRSLAARLHRLDAGGEAARLVLLRDPRLPIGRYAHATRRYLDDLTKAGARLVRPSLEALQALEALRTLLADARAGDLNQNGSPINPQTVNDWLAQHMPPCLNRLLEEITGNEALSTADPQLREDLLELLESRCLLPLEEAARDLQLQPAILRKLVEVSPELAGILEGPPPVLYRQVTPSPV
jgi:hypothetical protein